MKDVTKNPTCENHVVTAKQSLKVGQKGTGSTQKGKINPSSINPRKWSNTLKQFVGTLSTNCLSLVDHFVGLVLKGTSPVSSKSFDSYVDVCEFCLFVMTLSRVIMTVDLTMYVVNWRELTLAHDRSKDKMGIGLKILNWNWILFR